MDPFTITLLVASVAASAYSSYQQGQAQQAMSNYNADIAEQEAKARQQAIDAEARELTKGQREMKARQRMSVSGRGGLAGGTDLLSLANQAKEMQLDQLELRRQQDIAGIRGTSEAAMSRYQGQVAGYSGKWTAGTKLLKGGYQIGSLLSE